MSIDNKQANLVWEQMAKIQAAEHAVAKDGKRTPQDVKLVNNKAIKVKFMMVASNKATGPGNA